jgi:ABC-type amino acid transport substrate-binding protein
MGINDDGKFINKTLTGTNGVIKAMCINLPPFTYPDENGELIGLEVEALYKFAREYGYQLEIELKDVSSVNEIYQSLEDKSIDITSFLIQDINVSQFSSYDMNELEIKAVIRYSNHPDSVEWTTIYDSPKQFNGEKLGYITDFSFGYLYNEIFPDSELKYYKDNYDPLYDLLLEDINGFLTDDIIGKYFEKKFPDRITYYDMNVSNDLGFGFKKNENNTLLKDFNEFLATIDAEKLFEKWNVEDTFNIKVEKNNFTDGKTIKVGFQLDSKPFAYRENGEEKGFEIDLLYQFAKSQKYNVDFVELMTTSERMNLEDYDITGGSFTITEERAKSISFSDPIFKIGTALVVRTDSKKDKMKLTIYDNEYNEIPDNKATINAKIGDKTVISSCAFPKTFNDTFSINCTINDLNGIDPYSQGIDYINTTDKLRIVYSDLEIDNILKANDKLKLPIIVESNKTEHICSKEEEKGLSNIGRICLITGGVASIVAVALLALKICF